MARRTATTYGVLAMMALVTVAVPALASMRRVGPAILRPFYPPSPQETEIPMGAFWLDELPVTNGDFLVFVERNPRWRRDRASRLMVDERYLVHWGSAGELGAEVDPDQPVTNVSWFAAKAYCESRRARLPTANEWELAGQATGTSPDSRGDRAFRELVLEWYTLPRARTLPRVGQRAANFWKIRDLHGLVWEWVLDFNSALSTGDSREDGSADQARFCGAGALGASETEDYPSFMRIAMRSSLEARYTTSSLGFRCARDGPGGPR